MRDGRAQDAGEDGNNYPSGNGADFGTTLGAVHAIGAW